MVRQKLHPQNAPQAQCETLRWGFNSEQEERGDMTIRKKKCFQIYQLAALYQIASLGSLYYQPMLKREEGVGVLCIKSSKRVI